MRSLLEKIEEKIDSCTDAAFKAGLYLAREVIMNHESKMESHSRHVKAKEASPPDICDIGKSIDAYMKDRIIREGEHERTVYLSVRQALYERWRNYHKPNCKSWREAYNSGCRDGFSAKVALDTLTAKAKVATPAD